MSSADVTASLTTSIAKMTEIESPFNEEIDKTRATDATPIPFEVANFKPIEVDLAASSDAEANKYPENSDHQTSSSSQRSGAAVKHILSPSHGGVASSDNEAGACNEDNKQDNVAMTPPSTGQQPLKPGQQIGHALTQLRRTFTVTRRSPKEAPPDVAEKELRQSRSLGDSKKGVPLANTGAAAFARGVSNTIQYVVKHVKKGKETVKKADKVEKNEPTENTIQGAQEDTMTGKISQQGRTVLVQGFSGMDAVVHIDEKESVSMATPIMITKCSNTVFEIGKKCNKIEIDSCKNCRVTFSTVISSVDMQNSESCEVFCTAGCPGVNLDNVVSCRVHIPPSSVEGITVSSSGGGSAAIVITKPIGEDGGDMDEYQVPFQYVHRFKDGQLVSEVSPLYYH